MERRDLIAILIGSGPAGRGAAIRAAKRGHSVPVAEKKARTSASACGVAALNACMGPD